MSGVGPAPGMSGNDEIVPVLDERTRQLIVSLVETGIESALARIAGNTYATSALSRMTATAVDLGEKPAVSSAIAKYHTTTRALEMARGDERKPSP